MAGYTLKFLSGGTSVQGVGYLNTASSSPRRGALGAFSFGFTTVASAAFTWLVQDCTAAATGTSRTPTADDPADPATTFTAQDTITVDSASLTANSFRMYWPMYQNNSARWAALSDRQRKFIPATASNGFMFGLSAATVTIGAGSCDFDQL
jgi:hypothetical protein